jgi:toxin-antitoxin system PIN domain toxin
LVLVDTNVLVYAADDASPHRSACLAWLEARRSRPDAWYITWSIVYEFLRVTTHQRVLRRPWSLTAAWTFVDVLLASPGIEVLVPTERHGEVAAAIIDELPELAGNLLHDMHTAVLMREHGVARICTRDADFHRFTFLEVIDPLRG